MLFNSLIFLVFLAVVLVLYRCLTHRRQNLFLLVASYVFYGYWDWRFLSLLLISTAVDFYVGRGLHRTDARTQRRLWLAVSLVVNLGILGVFKYWGFFVDSAAAVLETWGLQSHRPVLSVVLPVGISFYTFQTLSYTFDIYRRRLEPTDRFLDFALFVSFFPQLVAGPIERAVNLLPQITRPRKVTRRHWITGLNLILIGYLRKVAIADTLAPIVDQVFAAPGGYTSGQLLTGVYAFCFQIYGDFAGYSDIARGVARLLGFELMVNFRAPYLSRTPAEFWRRWHISLSSWLRDYLYIALGGNRHGVWRTYRNLLVTMLLGGLWHGASWTFVVWGLLHGVYLIGYRLVGRSGGDLDWPAGLGARLRAGLQAVVFFHLVAVTWILFRAPDFATARAVLSGILTGDGLLTVGPVHVFVAALAMLTLDVVQERAAKQTWLADMSWPWRPLLATVLLAVVVAAATFRVYSNPAFIYFQF